MQVDVVLVSPLTRTLETASLMFPQAVAEDGKTGGGGGTSRAPPFVAVELCREAFGGHPCDQRRPISVVRREFTHGAPAPPPAAATSTPRVQSGGRAGGWTGRHSGCGVSACQRRGSCAPLAWAPTPPAHPPPTHAHTHTHTHTPRVAVDFSGVSTDADTWHNPERRETVREVAIRADRFLAVLRQRPERNIVVVSHGVFLETLMNRSALYCVDDALKLKRYENAELRSVCVCGCGCVGRECRFREGRMGSSEGLRALLRAPHPPGPRTILDHCRSSLAAGPSDL